MANGLRRVGLVTLLVAGLIAVGCGGDGDEDGGEQRPSTEAQGQILFAKDGDIHAIDPDGENETTLTQGIAEDNEAAWSPDRSQIVFVRDDHLHVMRSDGTNVERLARTPTEDQDPSWSSDGRKIAFAGLREDETFALYTINVDGTGLSELLSLRRGFVGCPKWSPNDKRLAICVDRTAAGGELDVYLVNADGRGLKRLTDTPGDDGAPDWSPDGERLLYGRGGGTGIYTLEVRDNEPEKLLDDPLTAATLTPVWSPDGGQIAWTAKFEGGLGSSIYVADAAGGESEAITEELALESSVDW